MESIYQFGLEMIASLQTLTWLDGAMRLFTFLGTKEFFIFVLPVIYWCLDARLGIQVAFILLLGTGFNEILKLALQGPRPYWISAAVKALSAESTFGIPSGHAQTAAGLWGLIALRLRRRWALSAAAIVIVLIGVSRLYLAVHFPQDVLAGWLLGALTLWAFVALWNPLAAWVRRRSLAQQLLLCLAPAVLILLPAATLANSLAGYQVPAEWMANAARAGEPLPAPVSLDSTITPAGAIFGFAVGLVLLQRAGGFKPSGPIWKRLLAFVVGILGIAVIYVGLKAVLPETDSWIGISMRFARYAALGFWVGAGAPWTFRRLGLT